MVLQMGTSCGDPANQRRQYFNGIYKFCKFRSLPFDLGIFKSIYFVVDSDDALVRVLGCETATHACRDQSTMPFHHLRGSILFNGRSLLPLLLDRPFYQ